MMSIQARHLLGIKARGSVLFSGDGQTESELVLLGDDVTASDLKHGATSNALVKRKEVKEEEEEGEEGATEKVETWVKEQSFVADSIGRAGSGSLYAITTTVAMSIASMFVGTLLLPYTDQYFLLLVLAADASLIIKFVRDAVYTWTHPELPQSTGMAAAGRVGRWIPVMLFVLDFIFLVLFFSATNIGLELVRSTLTLNGAFIPAGIFAAVTSALQILLLLSHPAFGMLTHEGELRTMTLATTASK